MSEKEPTHGAWYKTGVYGGITAVAVLVFGFAAFWKDSQDIQYQRDAADKQRAVEIGAEAVAIVEAQRVAEDAAAGAEFARCWPRGDCIGIPPVLPVDREQNDRLDEMEAAYKAIYQYIRRDCQRARDLDTAAGKADPEDCSGL